MREWRRWRRVVMVGSLTVVSVGTSVTGVRAGPASGGGTWQGTMTLNIFPCPGGGTCPGSFSGSLSGSVAGLDLAGHPFVVIWPDPTTLAPLVNLSASFTYSELCPLGALGSAGGSFTLSGGYVDDSGTISHDGAMTGNFGWTRAGLAVVVQTYGGVLTGGGSTLATQQTLGYGAGGFVPEAVPSTCFNVQQVTAQIAGSFVSPQ
jgi:hypothetical protein